jgi:O-acetylhomoserine/O-acetylserine sulfhydrylase-like pyridoxal-dependent enzyme
MLIRTSIVTGLAAILLSTAALADSTPATSTVKPKPTQNTQKMADRCSALETQFDQAITTHGNAAKAAAAKSLRTKGGTLCSSNKQASGIKNLQQALKDLGVKPSA